MKRKRNVKPIDPKYAETVMRAWQEVFKRQVAAANCQRCNKPFNYVVSSPPPPIYCKKCVKRLTGRSRIIRHVTYHRIADYLLLGWVVILPQRSIPYHDQWGVDMEWLCACRPRDCVQ